MGLLKKLKEVGQSIIPIVALVALLHFFVTPFPDGELVNFAIGGLFIIAGLAIFLTGTEIGLIPIGERIGADTTGTKNLWLVLLTGLAVGVIVIVAEPSIAVLADQVAMVNPAISTTLLVTMIALGFGFFMMIGMARVVLRIPLKWIYAISYGLLFLIFAFSSPIMMGIAFDSGGASTGPLSVPFVLAVGLGVARVQQKQRESDNFGLVSLVLIGPTFAIGILSLLGGGSTEVPTGEVIIQESGNFLSLILPSMSQVAQALVPLMILCLVYQVLLIKLPLRRLLRVGVGFIYLFIGLTLFFVGVNGGFIPGGFQIGYTIGSYSTALLLLVGLAIGAITVLSEPSVYVLVEQVEVVTQGHIKKPVMLTSVAIGVGLSVFLAVVRIITGLSLWYFVFPAYTLAVILGFLVPELFVGLSFDSGSVS
ncbi:MAG TPA: DUF1538 domain-containing protein, partial [Sphaerochaeta sp.]|nr:DUF1538 domain-containing protein [Sphaerochaeta sp.]